MVAAKELEQRKLVAPAPHGGLGLAVVAEVTVKRDEMAHRITPPAPLAPRALARGELLLELVPLHLHRHQFRGQLVCHRVLLLNLRTQLG